MLPAPALKAAPAIAQRVAYAGGEPAASAVGVRRTAGVGMSLQHQRIAELCEQLKLAGLGARVAGAGAGRRAR